MMKMTSGFPSQLACWHRRLAVAACLAVMLVAAAGMPAQAQPRGQRRGQPAQGDGVSPGEIQRLFDAYVVMQAQKELQLSDEQYPAFLARVKDLQAARQRGAAARLHVVQELRRLGEQTPLDEAQARAQLKALADIELRTAQDVRDALAAIDQVLDLRQQIQFRVFEEQMERRKVDLLMRARQARQRQAQPQPQQP